jgi:DNA-binding NarL/FixJ family response regulator
VPPVRVCLEHTPTRITVLPHRLKYLNTCGSSGAKQRDLSQVAGPFSIEQTKTILIADDNELVRTMIRRTLVRDTDFTVCGEAVDGTDAVSKAKELSPDLIILDVRMPGLYRIEVAGILRYALPKLKIVLLTMYAEAIEKNLTSLFRVDAVLTKTGGLTELTAHVRKVMADRRFYVVIPSESLTAI